MQELFGQLGIDWRLLLAQGVNFFVLLGVLTFFVYRPLVRLMEERRKKIEFGLRGASEVEERLKGIELMKDEKMAEADKQALKVISEAEKSAGARVTELITGAEKKSEDMLREAETVAAHKKQEALDRLRREAGALMRSALAKAVEADPLKIDEKLVQSAIEHLQQ